jgi:uncharacterized protein
MKALVASILMLGGLASGPALAQAPAPATQAADRPTDESVRQLLQIMQGGKIVQQAAAQLQTAFTAMLNKQLEGKSLSEEDRQRIAEARTRLKVITDKILTPETMEPIFVKVYADTFSQAEIDSLIGFYSSPAGQAIVAKLPLAAQNAMTATQQAMMSVMPQVQQIAKDTATQITSQHDKDAKHTTG